MPISTIGANGLNKTEDFTIDGLTVGQGGGNVASATVVGSGAMAATNTGAFNSAFGASAMSANTSGSENAAFGWSALKTNTTGQGNSAFGKGALQLATTSNFNSAFGGDALLLNTTGANNTAIGKSALENNTTASNNTAVGYQSLYSNTGADNTAVGRLSLNANTTGARNVAMGNSALVYNTTGGYNVGIGQQALASNTTANFNTAVGYQAGYSTTTGLNNLFIGAYAGSSTTGSYNTFVGGGVNGCGEAVTTGTKNTILGSYSGNQGGLDIRTASNRIVLSDGDGNPLLYTYNGYFAQNTNSGGRFVQFGFNIANVEKASIFFDNNDTNLYVRSGTTAGVYLTTGGTSWTSNSDERLKENLVEITNGLNKVCSLRSVIGNFISDEAKTPHPFLIAQDVQQVLPEAVTSTTIKGDETNTEYLGVSYTETIPLLVAAIKELNAKVQALEAKLASK